MLAATSRSSAADTTWVLVDGGSLDGYPSDCIASLCVDVDQQFGCWDIIDCPGHRLHGLRRPLPEQVATLVLAGFRQVVLEERYRVA